MQAITSAVLAVLLCVTPSLSASVTASSPNAPGTRVLVLAYSPGVMARVMQRHQDPRYPGDFVPGFAPRRDVQGYTAVSWSTRSMVGQNMVIVAKLYDPARKRWIVQRLQPSDWQRFKDRTPYQRLEVDGATAARLHFPGSATHAIILGYER